MCRLNDADMPAIGMSAPRSDDAEWRCEGIRFFSVSGHGIPRREAFIASFERFVDELPA